MALYECNGGSCCAVLRQARQARLVGSNAACTCIVWNLLTCKPALGSKPVSCPSGEHPLNIRRTFLPHLPGLTCQLFDDRGRVHEAWACMLAVVPSYSYLIEQDCSYRQRLCGQVVTVNTAAIVLLCCGARPHSHTVEIIKAHFVACAAVQGRRRARLPPRKAACQTARGEGTNNSRCGSQPGSAWMCNSPSASLDSSVRGHHCMQQLWAEPMVWPANFPPCSRLMPLPRM